MNLMTSWCPGAAGGVGGTNPDWPGLVMTTKIILILLGAAAFGWGFSELVEHSGNAIRSPDSSAACQKWNGTDCERTFQR